MKEIGAYRWRVIALLFFATTINYIDRQVIGILKPFISGELGWDESDYGFIVAAFQVAYALGLIVSGRFLDKFGSRLGYLFCVVLWSVAAVSHAAAKSVAGFAIARFALGIGEAANFPAAVKIVAEWFPKKQRAFATGLFNTGSTIGAIATPVIVSAVTVAWGWQWAFIVTGALGFIWVVVWAFWYQSPEKNPGVTKAELEYINQDADSVFGEKQVKWRDVIMHRQTVAICATRFISDWVWWFFLFWTPDFLSRTHGLDIKDVALPLILIYAVSSIGGIGGGWLSSKFIWSGKSIDYARKTTILICALLVLPIIFVYQTNNIWVGVSLIALAAAGHQAWASNIFTLVSDIFPKKAVATVTGLSGFAGAVGGALAASLVGILLESSGSYQLIFLAAGFAYTFNWLIIRLLIREIKPIQFRDKMEAKRQTA